VGKDYELIKGKSLGFYNLVFIEGCRNTGIFFINYIRGTYIESGLLKESKLPRQIKKGKHEKDIICFTYFCFSYNFKFPGL